VKVVVGLRNPGADYEGTRHNVGAEVVTLVVGRMGGRLRRAPSRTRMEVLPSGDVVWALPLSYMNDVGGPVSSLIAYYKASPSNLLVIHDDIDLELGRLRIQEGGGTGGHNGLRSIERSIGRDFWRLKMGVGRPPGRLDPAVYVLRRFGRAERIEMEAVVADAADAALRWLDNPVAARDLAGARRL
jgi:PTH1 family peptidyl-tRNA hydrolase